MVNPFLKDLCFRNAEIGLVLKTVGTAATIAGAGAGAAAMARLGLGRALWVFGVAQAAGNVIYALAAATHPGVTDVAACGAAGIATATRAAAYLAIAGEYASQGMGTAALVALVTRLCEKRYSATQYALLSSLFALGAVDRDPVLRAARAGARVPDVLPGVRRRGNPRAGPVAAHRSAPAARGPRGRGAADRVTALRSVRGSLRANGRYFLASSARSFASAASARTEKPGVWAYSSVATVWNGRARARISSSLLGRHGGGAAAQPRVVLVGDRRAAQEPLLVADLRRRARSDGGACSPVSMRMASFGHASTQKPQTMQRSSSMTNFVGYFSIGIVRVVLAGLDVDALRRADRRAHVAGDAAGLAVLARHQPVQAAVAGRVRDASPPGTAASRSCERPRVAGQRRRGSASRSKKRFRRKWLVVSADAPDRPRGSTIRSRRSVGLGRRASGRA